MQLKLFWNDRHFGHVELRTRSVRNGQFLAFATIQDPRDSQRPLIIGFFIGESSDEFRLNLSQPMLVSS
jgi:hypothetical protein